MNPTNQGRKDAGDGKQPKDLWNAPAEVQQKYNAAYDAERKKRGW